jgi:hypothetical protein
MNNNDNGTDNGRMNDRGDHRCVVSSQAELITLLSREGVRIAQWPIEHIETLWQEIKRGEATLLRRHNTLELVRLVQDVRAIVRFEPITTDPTRKESAAYTLVEAAHISMFGARRRPLHAAPPGHALETHIRPDEQPLEALQRLLRDMLGLGMPRVIHLLATDVDVRVHTPRFLSETTFRLYAIELDETQFVPQGYVGTSGATLHQFVWQPARESSNGQHIPTSQNFPDIQ